MSLLNNTSDSKMSESSQIDATVKTEVIAREDCMKCLLDTFGHTDFEENQWEIISSILNDKSDTLITMASGAGKSLCNQFPSVYLNTVTLVVSPFISSMQDHVERYCPKVKALFLGSGQTEFIPYRDIKDKYNVVYVTPEFITSERGTEVINGIKDKLTLIACDEAQFISLFGNAFRDEYKKLGILKELCPSVPILASTAIPSEEIRDDIIETLKLQKPRIISSSVNRPNVKFIVKEKLNTPGEWDALNPYINNGKKDAIVIYCVTKKIVDRTLALLNENGHKNECRSYHPDMSMKERERTVDDFNNDKIRIVVGTIAFGMGMQKSNVRSVIFLGIPLRLEDLFMLSGIASRDGLPAECVLFHSWNDFNVISSVFFWYITDPCKEIEKNSEIFKSYINTEECRRRFILSSIGEDTCKLTMSSDCCDNCEKKLNKIKAEKMDE